MFKTNALRFSRPLAMMIVWGGLLAFASGTAQAASCPTFASVGVPSVTHQGRIMMVENSYGGDWRPEIKRLEKTVYLLKSLKSQGVEKAVAQLSVTRCLADRYVANSGRRDVN